MDRRLKLALVCFSIGALVWLWFHTLPVPS